MGIVDNAVTQDQIASSAVGSSEIADGSVTTPKINDGAVTRAKIGNSAVGTGQLGANSVTQVQIAPNAVGEDQIIDGAVGTDQVHDDAITTTKIATDAVTVQKILEIPDLSGQAGKILQVNSTETGFIFVDIPSGGTTPSGGGNGGGATPPTETAIFRTAVKASKPFTASDYTTSVLPTHTGSLPATFTLAPRTFDGTTYLGVWVPDSEPISSIELGGGLNQIGGFTPVALTINGVAGKSYASNRMFISTTDTYTLRLS